MNTTKTTVESFYAPFNTGKTAGYDAILAPTWVNHPNDPGQTPDLAGFKAGVLDFRRAFDNFELTILKIIIDGNDVAVHLKMTGKMIGSFAEFPATQQVVTFYGLDRHELAASGQILATWHFEDFAGLQA